MNRNVKPCRKYRKTQGKCFSLVLWKQSINYFGLMVPNVEGKRAGQGKKNVFLDFFLWFFLLGFSVYKYELVNFQNVEMWLRELEQGHLQLFYVWKGITGGDSAHAFSESFHTSSQMTSLYHCVLFCCFRVKHLLVQKFSKMMEITQEVIKRGLSAEGGGSSGAGLAATSCWTQELGCWMSCQKQAQQSACPRTSQADSSLDWLPLRNGKNREEMTAPCTPELEDTPDQRPSWLKDWMQGKTTVELQTDHYRGGCRSWHPSQRCTRPREGIWRRGWRHAECTGHPGI